jgi:hypothetical protein
MERTIFAAVLMAAALFGLRPAAAAPADNPMPVGVDEAGGAKWIYDDPLASEAFERMGCQFVMKHFWGEPSIDDVDRLDRWAAPHGYGWLINQEVATAAHQPGDPAVYRRPGGFFQPPRAFVERCAASPRFLGFCYDECEHWICNGAGVTAGGKFQPHFFDAEGQSLDEAYEGNLFNLQTLMARVYPGFAAAAHQHGGRPVVGTENVFPILQHLFARAGLVQFPKLLKETVTPVTLAMSMGAAKQYGVQNWTSIDLWWHGQYPGHNPEELRSALLIAYWTASERTYIENLTMHGSLWAPKDGHAELSALGEVTRQFVREYLPAHPRPIHFEDFAPEVIIVRFPDSDWGQEHPGPWIRRNLYGASNLVPDDDTRYWLKIWHVLSHDTIPLAALNYNTPLGIPYRVFFPANNVAVYDHRAADPKLYAAARLVFLTGKEVDPACLATLQTLVAKGLTVVTRRKLAPPELAAVGASGYEVHPVGAGRWIVTDDVMLPAVRALLAPYLGRPDELRYVFGADEVVFTASEDGQRLDVRVGAVAKG